MKSADEAQYYELLVLRKNLQSSFVAQIHFVLNKSQHWYVSL